MFPSKTSIVSGKPINSNYALGMSVNQYVTFDDTDALAFSASPFSVALWAKIDTASTRQGLVLHRDGASVGWRISCQANGLGLVSTYSITGGADYTTANSTTRIDDGQWHHIVGTWTTASGVWVTQIYIDSVLEDEDAGSHAGTIQHGIDINLGRDSLSGHYLDGSMDEVSFHSKVLNLAEVGFLYGHGTPETSGDARELSSASTNLVTYWRLEEGSGASTADDSTNSYTGTLVNTPTWKGH